jgi:prepilin-type N-terminal cleavage/methylation domain-containing protein
MKTGLQDYGTTGPRTADYGSRTTRRSFVLSSGFTLLELLTVIGIIGIIAAIALPTINSFKPNASATATRQLLDAVTRARQLALSQRSPVLMVFVPTNITTLTGTNLGRVQPLLDRQLIGYAYLSWRSVGDQPGMRYPRYLSSWRTLPQGAYIPLDKFWPGLTIPNTTLGNVFVPPFLATNNIPFPTEDNPVNVPMVLPYIAFDGMGRLVAFDGTGRLVPGRDELIPISQGSVSFARDPATKLALPQPPAVREVPAGNTTSNYSLVYIDQLTGRGRIEHRKVQ